MCAELMNVWKSEISKYVASRIRARAGLALTPLRHVKPSRLLVCEFHGPKRAESPGDLVQTGSDIVITTYSTLVEDSKKCQKDRVLQNIIWYRVVLDEGLFWVPAPGSMLIVSLMSYAWNKVLTLCSALDPQPVSKTLQGCQSSSQPTKVVSNWNARAK